MNPNVDETPNQHVITTKERNEIAFTLCLLRQKIAGNTIAKGFRPLGERRNPGELIALIHSELSEGLEAIRKDIDTSDHIPEFSGIEEELADVVIRVLDFADEYGLRIEEAIITKHNYNTTRPHKHGKKF